jgi:hypothetical protein
MPGQAAAAAAVAVATAAAAVEVATTLAVMVVVVVVATNNKARATVGAAATKVGMVPVAVGMEVALEAAIAALVEATVLKAMLPKVKQAADTVVKVATAPVATASKVAVVLNPEVITVALLLVATDLASRARVTLAVATAVANTKHISPRALCITVAMACYARAPTVVASNKLCFLNHPHPTILNQSMSYANRLSNLLKTLTIYGLDPLLLPRLCTICL